MKKTLAVLAAALIAASSAQAGLIEQTATIAMSQTDWSERLSFDQFDPANGVLTGVSFWIDANVVTTFSGRNKRTPVTTIFNLLDGSMEFDLPSGLLALKFSESINLRLGPKASYSETRTQTLPGGAYAQDPASFYGIDQFWVSVNAKSWVSNGGPSNVASAIANEASASVTLRYDYSASEIRNHQSVPEPTTLALAGLALAGLALARRRA